MTTATDPTTPTIMHYADASKRAVVADVEKAFADHGWTIG